MIKKTYITRMPDRSGAFLLAGRIISEAGDNIVRVNYNRAVDTHTLFIEVSADEEQHALIERRLTELGYLTDRGDDRQILMIVLRLPDVPGTVLPVLEILGKYSVNISYISARENGTGWQDFKMGLLIDNTDEITRLLDEISRICEIRVLDYEVTDRLLDGTVFYITFANEMRSILSLGQEQTNDVLIWANQIMQQLDEKKEPVLQIFEYIRRFAHPTPISFATGTSCCSWTRALPATARRCSRSFAVISRALTLCAAGLSSRTPMWTTPVFWTSSIRCTCPAAVPTILTLSAGAKPISGSRTRSTPLTAG